MRKVATVVGLGVSGAGAVRLLNEKGWEVRVTEGADAPPIQENMKGLRRLRGVKWEIGKHTRPFIEGANLVITSPGVKDSSPPLIWARGLNIPIIDEIELGYRFCPAKIVAVTGTNGKSTTTTLIGEILKAGKREAAVCGNIGVSFCEKVLSLSKEAIAVLEISSFQLQRVVNFRPYVSLFLNITQNHLDRHRNFREYLDAKLNVFKNQEKSDWAILNYEDKNLKYLHKHIRPAILYFGDSNGIDGAYLRDNAIFFTEKGKKRNRFLSSDELALKGEHNIRNAMAALLVGNIFRVKPEITKEVLRGFKGLAHRCEYVAEIDGRTFINDSKATTVDAARWAIRSLDRPVVLIAGGRDKGSDFTVLKGAIEGKVRHLILLGEAKGKIRTQLLGSTQIHEAQDLKTAVSLSFDLANRGEAVLLSPMCASFDMFKNFEDRGDQFKKAVMSLKAQIGTDKRNRLAQIHLCKIQ